MDAGGASAASSSSIPEEYDVFLSFRGEDTRNNFTSHLFAALKRKQIETYMDDKSLERGDDITLALPEAIRKSKISIIIFSKDYASSSWCLRELVHMLECRRENNQMVIPIFYKVDPSKIRNQTGSYGESFQKHEDRFKDNMEMVKRWRAALTESADLSGWDSEVTRPEAELVEAIADNVLRKLNRVPSSNVDEKDLVGIKEQIQEIELLLSLGSSDIRIIGIWGLGGLGKTTLAGVVFNKHRYQFDSCCFLANVREESEKLGLINLRDKLIGELLKEGSMNLGTPSLPPHVKDRRSRQKVLIVLDDVNNSEQLRVLVGDRDLFGHGSRIVVTTRDANVLQNVKADGMYGVRQLNYGEALELFKLKAFRGDSATADFIELSEEVVRYAGGIPLAINILASHLRSLDSQCNWEMVLEYLKEDPGKEIDKNLRISYDGLYEKEQAIFLDIACFFKGEWKESVENILNGCGFWASIQINNLVNKSLISIRNDRLWMHDLVQEMGQKIVQQRSEGQPRKQSRLWIAKDAYRVLNKKKGTKNIEGGENIEGIFLNMAEIDKELHLSPDVFQKMSKLRLLKIYNTIIFDDCRTIKPNKVHLDQDLHSLPDTLRYLHWEGYPSKQLPSDFEPQNLVEMNMPYNQLEKLPNEDQDFDNLKSTDLSHSLRLTEFPVFSHAPKLEKINLHSSVSLLQVPSDSFPITRSLVSLNLSSTAIVSLPSSIDSLKKLSELYLTCCRKLKNLPSNIEKLDSLRYLELSGCDSLEKFPALPKNIEDLSISSAAIKELAASSIDGRFGLKTISLVYCKNLESLPTSFFKLRSLENLFLGGCSKLKDLPEVSEPMKHLKFLSLFHTGIRQLPSKIENLVSVEDLLMDGCKNLEYVPSSIHNMIQLQRLELTNCPKLEHRPEPEKREGTGISLSSNLYSLRLSGSNITEIPVSLKKLFNLRELYVEGCENLRYLPELPLGLSTLDAKGCVSLEMVSNSERPFTQKPWDGYRIGEAFYEYFSFRDCLKLDQKERRNITNDFHLRVLRKATRLLSPKSQELDKFQVRVCCPGDEIPTLFEYQWEGSFIKLKPPPEWCANNILGFVVCAVAVCNSDMEVAHFRCKFNVKENHGKNYEFGWKFRGLRYLPSNFTASNFTASNSSNVYMGYEQKRDFCSNFLHAEEVSIDFSVNDKKDFCSNFLHELDEWEDDELDMINSSKWEVKKCGIHVLYRQNVEEEIMNLRNQH